eukprot:s2576_g6.t1
MQLAFYLGEIRGSWWKNRSVALGMLGRSQLISGIFTQTPVAFVWSLLVRIIRIGPSVQLDQPERQISPVFWRGFNARLKKIQVLEA